MSILKSKALFLSQQKKVKESEWLDGVYVIRTSIPPKLKKVL